MNALASSPIDALVFDYVSFGFFTIVNNLLTWVAVVTAAVSFWRMKSRTVAVSVNADEPPPPSSGCTEPRQSLDPVSEAYAHKPLSTAVPPVKGTTSTYVTPSGLDENGTTKGKFVVYYCEDERENHGNVDEECDGDCNGEVMLGGQFGCGEWRESWDRLMLTARMVDEGWYRYRDLTVINGNVVRLWDGVRSENCIAGCVTW